MFFIFLTEGIVGHWIGGWEIVLFEVHAAEILQDLQHRSGKFQEMMNVLFYGFIGFHAIDMFEILRNHQIVLVENL